MINSKRHKITEIVFCVVLVLLLSLSLTLSLTGAWFTDAAAVDTSRTVSFGTISLGNNTVETGVITLKPGQTIAYGGTTTSNNITYGGNVGAYYRLKLTSSNNTIQNYLSFTSNGQRVIYGELAENGYIPCGTITFSANATNDLQNVTFNVVVTVDVIQKANLPGAYFDGNGDVNYASLFAYYDSLS